MKKIPLGIQLYSVRELCATDFKGTVRELAKMGYKGVEFAGQYGNMVPEELADFLKEQKLKVCGCHTSLDEINNPNSMTYAYSKATKNTYLTTSLCGRVAKDWDQAIKDCEVAGKTAKKNGFIFTYHNHAQEFEKINGVYALDKLYAETNPKEVYGEFDTHWIKRGGEDPVAYIRKYKGRVPQIHLKDITADNNFVELGKGILDLTAIVEAGVYVGAKWLIYEQDICKGSALAVSYTHLTLPTIYSV